MPRMTKKGTDHDPKRMREPLGLKAGSEIAFEPNRCRTEQPGQATP